MFLVDLINNLVPQYYSQLEQMRATTVLVTSFAISGAMILLVLYWLVTKSFETKITIFVVLAIIFLLGICTVLVMQGQLAIGAWLLLILMILMNFSNMALYGVGTSSSAAYLIPVLLAMFCIGKNAGIGTALLGCIFVFAIPILQSKGYVKSLLPYSISNLTFDAPVLALIYLLIAILVSNWADFSKNTFLN
jgi:hypothetical protein